MKELGLIGRLPKLSVIQAEGANALVRTMRETGGKKLVPVHAETMATAIKIGSPASWKKAVRVLEATGGAVEQVSEVEMALAKAEIGADGIGCEPASAVTLAGLKKPCFTSFFNPASVTADAGSQPILPSAPISALASAISTSLTCSTVPPVASSTRTAFFHDAGLPILMAVAMVSAWTEISFLPPASRMVRTSALAPSAWMTESFGRLGDQTQFFHLQQRLSQRGRISQVATGNNYVIRNLASRNVLTIRLRQF